MSNVGKFGVDFLGSHSRLERERKFLRRLFLSSIKGCSNGKEKRDARANLFLCFLKKPNAFLTFSLPSLSSLLKVSTREF